MRELADITLVHPPSKETRTVPIINVSRSWKVLIRWGLAGLYWFDLKEDCLLNGRRKMPWRALDKDAVEGTWHRLAFPEKHLKESVSP